MIGALRTWLLSIIAAGLVLAILYALVPKGRLRPIVRTTGGVALMLVILQPVLGFDFRDFAVSYQDYAQEIQALTEEYREADAEVTAAGDDYFATARLSRKQARDTAISMLQEAQVDENAAEDVLNEASQTLQVLAAYTVAESQIESLVVAKGYADCVAFMGEDSVSVVVSDPDGLDAVDVARIKDIVVSETSYTPDQIRIMEAGASAASQTGSTQEAEVSTSAAQTDEQADDAK